MRLFFVSEKLDHVKTIYYKHFVQTGLNTILTHYPAHFAQVSLQDRPQSPQAWVRGQQYCALEPRRSEDHDSCHHECKAVHTQQRGWQFVPDYQPSTLWLQSWVYE